MLDLCPRSHRVSSATCTIFSCTTATSSLRGWCAETRAGSQEIWHASACLPLTAARAASPSLPFPQKRPEITEGEVNYETEFKECVIKLQLHPPELPPLAVLLRHRLPRHPQRLDADPSAARLPPPPHSLAAPSQASAPSSASSGSSSSAPGWTAPPAPSRWRVVPSSRRAASACLFTIRNEGVEPRPERDLTTVVCSHTRRARADGAVPPRPVHRLHAEARTSDGVQGLVGAPAAMLHREGEARVWRRSITSWS